MNVDNKTCAHMRVEGRKFLAEAASAPARVLHCASSQNSSKHDP